MKFTRGYDIDGVLVPRLIVPQAPYVVISGRRLWEWKRTIQEIGTSMPIFLRPYGRDDNRDSGGIWKAQMISDLRIEEFFEDDPYQAEIIRFRCPFCKVTLVKA